MESLGNDTFVSYVESPRSTFSVKSIRKNLEWNFLPPRGGGIEAGYGSAPIGPAGTAS